MRGGRDDEAVDFVELEAMIMPSGDDAARAVVREQSMRLCPLN